MRYPAAFLTILTLLAAAPAAADDEIRLPWSEAGLTEAEAAAHLLERFAYGPRPGEIERVVDLGLERWLARQLGGGIPDRRVEGYVANLRSLDLSAREVTEVYPDPGLVLREAARAGVIDRGGMEPPGPGDRPGMDYGRRKVMRWARQRGYRPVQELVGELMVHKLYRAVYSENQLQEVLTDFWFNHFNVSISDNQARAYVPSYERDAIRPFVLGSFRDLLAATAKHPAMLHYLDNVRSVAGEGAPTTFEPESFRRGRRGRFGGRGAPPWMDDEERQIFEQNRPRGLNENYARELLELHTLGVDGGYTEDDVVAVARAFTGWATYPPARRREVEERIARARSLPQARFVFEESFIFRADVHDAAKKTVLGRTMPAGRGIEDGYEVLERLAVHPSTARHLATKLAVRFVSDEPPRSLVDRLEKTFLTNRGNLEEVIATLASSPEFWSPEARRQKIKSPFEVAVSALRILDAEIAHPRATVEWVARMGQPLYAYQAPTGYPDRADAWVNTGSLLHRMNFGLELATGRIAGVRFDLAALNQDREPESLDAALRAYVPLLLPERDPEPTIARLQAIVRDPELAKRLAEKAPSTDGTVPPAARWLDGAEGDEPFDFGFGPSPRRRFGRGAPPTRIDSSPLAHVVGVILGSPEFQRR